MKNDIDGLMQINNIDALIVTGSAQHNPAMVYLTGGAYLSEAELIKKVGEKPVLFCTNAEREEAMKTGLDVRSYETFGMPELLKRVENNYIKAVVLRYKLMLEEMDILSGNVALYGQIDLGAGYVIFSALQRALPKIIFIGHQENDILSQAMMTKDTDEIKRIEGMGKITAEVVSRVSDYLSTQQINNGNLVNRYGEFICIGDIKRMIDVWLVELGAENPHGTIFAIGRDTAIPHNKGNESDVIRTGQPIIFDIYPCERGGGYFYDFTRTWCLGYATDDVFVLYDQVISTYKKILEELRPNVIFSRFQKLSCELFKAMGHPTIEMNSETISGYTHSLGHGVGLYVHERPYSGIKAKDDDKLVPGSVFTIEPGLYYPDKGIGVRVENTFYVSPKGNIDTFVDYPLDLVLPVKNNGR